MKKTKTHYVDGKWIDGSGRPFASIDPAATQIIWEGCEADSAEIHAAIESSKKASSKWAETPLTKRINYLEKFRNALISHADLLIEAISIETGKPLWDAKTEVAAMINKVAISIKSYGIRCCDLSTELPQGLSIARHRPHGIMAVFGPFNFPGHLPNGHIIPALLAGNVVIFKPSELTPQVAELTVKLWEKCKLPKGVLNLLQGGSQTGKQLSSHPDIDGLLFTGSSQTGQSIARQFSAHPEKILALEMGGNNPLVIGTIKNLKAAAYLTIQSAYLSSGQRCTCARRLIVPKGRLGNAFLKELISMIKNIRIGSYNDNPEPFMGPVISAGAANALIAKQKELFAAGGELLVAMSPMNRGPAFLSPGLIDVTNCLRREDEEIFGPLLQVIRVSNFEQSLNEANRTQYGLVAGLLSEKQEEYHRFYQNVRAGIINWNLPLTGASSAMPFGGIKKSGNHRPSAFYAADYCAYPVASMESPTLEIPHEAHN